LSLVQTLLYVLIGNWILEIHGMVLSFWLILFTTSCFANLVGLLISSVFNSVVAIYIMVPLIMVPQILLSGVVVNYNKLNNYVASKEFVPLVGDMMASRWAYESLLVTQFEYNDYQKHYFAVEKQESNDKFKLLFVLPELKKVIYKLKLLKKNELKSHPDDLLFLNHELHLLKHSEYASYFNQISLTNMDIHKIEKAVNQLNDVLPDKLTLLSHRQDSITQSLVVKYGGVDHFLDFKNRYYNNNLADMVLKRKELESFEKTDNQIIRLMEPIYQIPVSSTGRAQFLSSTKIIFGLHIDTKIFNHIAIWLMSLSLYGILIIFSNFRTKPN